VRELENFIERAVILHPDEVPEAPLATTPQASPPVQASPLAPPARGAPAATLAEVERRHILEVLTRSGGNRTRAARVLGIHRRTLHRKLKRYRTLDPLSG
jgi:DNA-binding NtrC family response regulator